MELGELIQQIGAYAGLAAVVGLAVLAALYFSQARDVRELREQEAARPPAPAAPPPPGQAAQRLQEQRGVAPARTAVAVPAASQAATAARPGAPVPAGAPPAPDGAGSRPPAGPLPGGPERVRIPPTRTGVRLPPRTPPPSRVQAAARQPWYRGLAPRYLFLLVAGVLIVGGGAAYGIASLVGGGEEPSTLPGASAPVAETKEPLDPSEIRVAVLNGTQVPGLAAQIGDTVESAGFARGNIDNASSSTANESAVLYAGENERAARAVAKELGISQIQPIDPTSQQLAGEAEVVVIVGSDQTQ